tara:strand:+ start:930 stop:1259 length:330 start_codon:yes stop_codon:yes gene_type:complete
LSKTVKSISKLIATMSIAVIGAFVILHNSKESKIDSVEESCMVLNDSTLIGDTIVNTVNDSIKPKTIVIKAKDTTIIKSVKNRTFNITLLVKDTMVSDTSSLMKSFYKK